MALSGFPDQIKIIFGDAWKVASPYVENDVLTLTKVEISTLTYYYTVTGESVLSAENNFKIRFFNVLDSHMMSFYVYDGSEITVGNFYAEIGGDYEFLDLYTYGETFSTSMLNATYLETADITLNPKVLKYLKQYPIDSISELTGSWPGSTEPQVWVLS